MTILNEINIIVRQLREITGTKVIVLVHEDPDYYELQVKDICVYATHNTKELYRILIAMMLLANAAAINVVKDALEEPWRVK